MSIIPVKQSFFTDIYRELFWFIAKSVLYFLDGFFAVLNKIWRYQFFENEYVNKIFSGALIVACSWLILKVLIELIMNFIIKSDDRSSPLSIYRGIALAIILMFLITPLFTFGHQFSTALTDSVISVSGMESSNQVEGAISKTIIKSMINKDEMEEESVEYLLTNWKSIDINETTGGFVGFGDVYIYSLNFFVLIIISVVCIFLLFFVAIQMAKRVMEIALYKIIGPFCCTGLTNPNSKTFEIWAKSTIGLFLITVVQFVCIGLFLNMFGSSLGDTDLITSIFLMIGALLFIISTPTIVSTLLNHHSGAMTAFGDIQSLMALSQGVSQGVGIAKAGSSMVLAKSAGVVGGKMGGGSISNMFNKGNKLDSKQMSSVKESLGNQNSHKAHEQIKEFLPGKSGKNNSNVMKSTTANPFLQPYSMKYNPIKNQYMNQNNSENIHDRKWY